MVQRAALKDLSESSMFYPINWTSMRSLIEPQQRIFITDGLNTHKYFRFVQGFMEAKRTFSSWGSPLSPQLMGALRCTLTPSLPRKTTTIHRKSRMSSRAPAVCGAFWGSVPLAGVSWRTCPFDSCRCLFDRFHKGTLHAVAVMGLTTHVPAAGTRC